MLTGRHISGQFQVELEALRTQVLAMGGLVEQQVSLALEAMAKLDLDLAKQVRQDEKRVNQMELVIDENCTRIIAKRQPTARDLRLVMATIKLSPELERIGDMANQIAAITQNELTKEMLGYIRAIDPLGKIAFDMLHQVLDAFARMDIESAARIYTMDTDLDDAYELYQKQLTQTMMENPQQIPRYMQLLKVAQCIERIGDRCQNICEYILYSVKGKDIRHQSGNLNKHL